MTSWRGLVFWFGLQRFAISTETILRVAHTPLLAEAPLTPDFISGYFSYRGRPVAVIRLDRLLDMAETALDFYAPLIVLKGEPACALHIEALDKLVSLQQADIEDLPSTDSFNGCATAKFRDGTESVVILDPHQLLLQQEKDALASHAAREAERLAKLRGEDGHAVA